MTLPRIAAACLLAVLVPGPVSAAAPEDLDTAIERATAWLEGVRLDPFAGGPLQLRLFTVETETWHRLAALESDPARRSRFQAETATRLREVLDGPRLDAILAAPQGQTIFSELVVLAARCREYGIDPASLCEVLARHRDALLTEIRRAPPSIQALYLAYLPATGIESPFAVEEVRARGMLARRPAEADLGLADVYYLTHEIFAGCDYGLRSFELRAPAERLYLLRVLPFYALLYAGLGNLDIVGELVVCLRAVGMRDVYGYREGLRYLLERQNPDGSFGASPTPAPDRKIGPADVLHPTMNALTALLLERQSLRSSRP